VAGRFRNRGTRALFAGLAAHSFLSLDEPLSAAFAMLMAVPAHAVGWPIPRGGAQSLTNALCRFLSTFGSKMKTSSPVQSLAALEEYNLLFCDLTPRQLIKIGGERLSENYKRRLGRYRYGAGVFKVDYALNAPIPWKAPGCCEQRRYIWEEALRRLLRRKRRCESGITPSVRSCCWPSLVFSIVRALQRTSTRLGLIAMCPMGRK